MKKYIYVFEENLLAEIVKTSIKVNFPETFCPLHSENSDCAWNQTLSDHGLYQLEIGDTEHHGNSLVTQDILRTHVEKIFLMGEKKTDL